MRWEDNEQGDGQGNEGVNGFRVNDIWPFCVVSSNLARFRQRCSDLLLINVGRLLLLFSAERIYIFHEVGPFWSKRQENN